MNFSSIIIVDRTFLAIFPYLMYSLGVDLIFYLKPKSLAFKKS